MRILSLLILVTELFFSSQKTESPHGADFKVSCKTCHSSSSWQLDTKIYSFNHNNTKFKLVGEHKVVGCRECHPTLKFAEAKTNCNDCHVDIHQATTEPDCSRCHTPSSWLVNNIIEVHQMSRFPLNGVHRTVDCSLCHKSESSARFEVVGVNCIDCHRQNYLATTKPNHVQSGISENCILCHRENSFQWTGAGFDHTAFPLTLGHAAAKCNDCHLTPGVFTGAKQDCYSCHQKDFLTAKVPDHTLGRFSTTCLDCHTTAPGWKPVTFNHNSFPLTQGHSTPACIDCHTGGNYTATAIDCYSCHQKDYLATTNPNHSASGVSKICQTCHTLNPGWTPVTFNHSAFPLTLGHSGPICTDCHTGTNYAATPVDCYSCHQKDFVATTNPNHTASGISQICQTCHTTNPGWKPVTFNHTAFPLTLGHASPVCIDCHKGGNYTTTPVDCYSCHQADFLAATNPNHTLASFTTLCQTCHTTNPGWKPATFTHTGFSLTLGHSGLACSDCHTGGNYATTSTDCYSCHKANYLATTIPNHTAVGYPTTCSTCHTLNPGWKPATFTHTALPLTLGHAIPACTDCHKGGNYTTIPTDCYSCHTADYTATTNPNHVAAGIPTTCTTCHTTNPGWAPATFSHTTFPLTLGHATPACNDCHKGNYTTTSTVCYSCHTADYTATTNPNHVAAGIPTTCTTCHTTNPGWAPATFSHTTFPLTLGHATPTCNDCHKGNYTTTSNLCYSCHTTDYNNTTNPNHITLAFATTCNTCHTTVPGWKPATYTQHDAQFFPIYSGRHQGRWTLCTDCHTNTANYALYTCLTCHSKASMDSAHSGRSGYSYVSTVCYSCHPRGTAG